MWVEKRMHRDLITVTKGDSIKTAIDLIREKKIRHLPVVDGKKLVGIVTDRDVRAFYPGSIKFLSDKSLNVEALLDRLEKTKVEEVMAREVITVTPHNTFEYASSLLHQKKIGALPVVEGGDLVGIITEADMLDAFLDVMGTNVVSSLIELEVDNRSETLERLCRVSRDHNAEIISMYTTPSDRNKGRRNLVVRLGISHPDHLVAELREAGYKVVSCTTSG